MQRDTSSVKEASLLVDGIYLTNLRGSGLQSDYGSVLHDDKGKSEEKLLAN